MDEGSTHAELVRQRGRKPPHPQAGRAANWAASWLGTPIEITDEELIVAVADIQQDIAVGSTDSALDHLGEAASIAMLQAAGTGRLITDDHAARAEARRRGVRASSTVGVVAHLIKAKDCGVDATLADAYLQTLQAEGRMHVQLKSADLFAPTTWARGGSAAVRKSVRSEGHLVLRNAGLPRALTGF